MNPWMHVLNAAKFILYDNHPDGEEETKTQVQRTLISGVLASVDKTVIILCNNNEQPWNNALNFH